ncbi:MAG: hypothetical protein Q9172_005630 [Xanthocarpia lactea]
MSRKILLLLWFVAFAVPCEERPDQPHCLEHATYTTPPQPTPTNVISSKPLSPNQVYTSLRRINTIDLAAKLSAIGVDTTSQPWTQAELVEEAWKQYRAFMGNLDIGSVDPAASYATFEQGAQAWTYYEDRVFT